MQPCKHLKILSTHVSADVVLLDSIIQATCVFWHVLEACLLYAKVTGHSMYMFVVCRLVMI